eukprot:s26_g86.t1
MPPVASRPLSSANADTPRGFRTPRGERPHHESRAGSRRPDQSGRRRFDKEPEKRTSSMNDAFNSSAVHQHVNAKSFQEALLIILKGGSAIVDYNGITKLQNDKEFRTWGGHLTWLLRHLSLTHNNGSPSLAEILCRPGATAKLRALHQDHRTTVRKALEHYDAQCVRPQYKGPGKMDSVKFLLPLAHAVLSSNKNRFQVGFHTTENFQAGTTPPEESFELFDYVDRPDLRRQQAAAFEKHDVTTIFLRCESGHSNTAEVSHKYYNSADFTASYIVHGTDENLIPSIAKKGLLPGGTRGSRKHSHFVTDNMLTTHEDAVRRESNCLIIYKHDALDDYRVWRTQVGYLLCANEVPLSRAFGIWSLRRRCWYQKPNDSDLSEITDMSGDKDLMCHIWHLQLISDKRQQLGHQAHNWSRQQFIEYVFRSMQDDDVKASMLEGMYKAMPESQKGYVNLEQPNANERDLTQPEDEDSQRIKMMKQAMFELQARAMKKYIKKRDGGLDTSESEAEAKETDDDQKLDFGIGQKISAKTMPPPCTPRTPRAAKAAGEAEKKPQNQNQNQLHHPPHDHQKQPLPAGAYIRAMSGDRNVTNVDCMILISLSYGKQSQVSLSRTASQKASADGVVGSAYSDEVMLQDVERVKYLQNIDLGLKDSDQAAHSPLIAIAKLFCQRNLRVRTEQSENRRRGRRGQRQPRYEQQQDKEEEEIEVEETEEENEPVGRLRSTTPSSGARLHGREEPAKAAGRFENPNRRIPVTPPKTPPAPPPRRRDRSTTPPGRNTQQRTDRPPVKTPPRSSWYQQQQDQYNYYNQPYQRSAPSAPISTPPPPPPAPVRTPQRPAARWGHQRQVEYADNYIPYTGPRWERRSDGSWFDRTPQFPWESIFYHQPTAQRRWNELWLYGYAFSMGL